MKRTLAALILALLPGAANADAASDTLETCVRAALKDPYSPGHVEQTCVGRVAEPCLGRPGGETTVGTLQCVQAEGEGWGTLLNAYWKKLRAYSRDLDAEGADGAADLLLAAQRAWLDYRDNACRFAYAEFTGGSLAPVFAAYCVRDLTARRTIDIMGTAGLGQ